MIASWPPTSAAPPNPSPPAIPDSRPWPRWRLRQLGIRRRHWATQAGRPVTGWGSTTDTEQAVAGLVAEGLNNGQVAARMYISTHTVAHHLRQAFRKLSIASRVELTRIVIEQATGGAGTQSRPDTRGALLP